MTYFALGYWVLGLAVAVAMVGALVGLACIRQSWRARNRSYQLVWLVSAAFSLGTVGIWLAAWVTMLGVSITEGTVRYELGYTVAGAVLAALGVLAGLLITGRDAQPGRLAFGSAVAGIALGGTHFVTLRAMEIQGVIQVSVVSIVAVLVAASLIAAGLFAAAAQAPSAPLVTLTTLVFGLAVVGLHYAGMAGLSVQIDPAAPPPNGHDLFSVFVPIFVLAILSLAVPITAVLVAPEPASSTGRRKPAAASPTEPAMSAS